MSITIETLLERLERVEQKAPERWMASCPAHQDKTPSLSIRPADNGGILLYDFGGCDNDAICAAIGIRVADLMPNDQRRPFDWRDNKTPIGDVLELLDHESGVVWLCATQIRLGRPLTDEEYERVTMAARRIGDARALLRPLKAKRRVETRS